MVWMFHGVVSNNSNPYNLVRTFAGGVSNTRNNLVWTFASGVSDNSNPTCDSLASFNKGGRKFNRYLHWLVEQQKKAAEGDNNFSYSRIAVLLGS
jgi:hypothetical protein